MEDEQPYGKLKALGKRQIREYKRGKIYYIRWNCLFETEEGVQSWHWSQNRTCYGKKVEAEGEAEKYRQELEALIDRPPSAAEPFGRWIDEFQAKREREAARQDSSLSPLTVQRDRLDFDRLRDKFGAKTLNEITAGAIVRTYEGMREAGVSKNAIHKFNSLLSMTIEYAIGQLAREDAGFSYSNPCKLQVVHDEAKRPKAQKREPLTQKEASGLAKALLTEEVTGHTVAVWLALLCGMRRGECLGLAWGDVDLDEAVLRVRNQYAKDKELRAPKSYESQRLIAVDSGTVVFLKAWKSQQRNEFEEKGVMQTSSSPVCSNSLCGWIDPDTFSRWRRAWFADHGLGRFKIDDFYTDRNGIKRRRRSGYEGHSLHDLRHTSATLLIGEDTDIKTVQGRLGHADVSLTLNTYTHVIKAKDREAANTLWGLLSAEE